MGSAALLGAATLAGCQTDFLPDVASKANAPIPPKLLAEIAKKNMAVGSPILLRVFKTEAELEVWKQDRKGRFALLKTYRSANGRAISVRRSAKATGRRRRASMTSRRGR